jgi:hypothetical protein
MSNEDLKETLEALRKTRDEIGNSPERARAFLVRAGILTPDGQVAEPYRQEA